MLARQVQTMAAYNRWMNDKLYAACAELSDEERKADRKAFFKSIHGTLNHILLADRVWFGRFIGRPVTVKSLDQELYADFGALRAERASTDQDIEGWAQGLRDEQLAGKLRFTSIVRPESRCHLFGVIDARQRPMRTPEVLQVGVGHFRSMRIQPGGVGSQEGPAADR